MDVSSKKVATLEWHFLSSSELCEKTWLLQYGGSQSYQEMHRAEVREVPGSKFHPRLTVLNRFTCYAYDLENQLGIFSHIRIDRQKVEYLFVKSYNRDYFTLNSWYTPSGRKSPTPHTDPWPGKVLVSPVGTFQSQTSPSMVPARSIGPAGCHFNHLKYNYNKMNNKLYFNRFEKAKAETAA